MDVISICLLFFAFLTITSIAYYIFWRKRWMSVFARNGIKGPKPHLIYGNLVELKKDGSLKCFEKWLKEYGSIFGYYNGGRPLLVVADPELLKQVFIKDFKLFCNRNAPEEFSTQANVELATSALVRKKGKDWKELRTLLRPAFSPAKLRRSIPNMCDAVDELIESIENENKKDNGDIDIYPLFQGLSLDVIGRSAFGVRTNVQKNPNDPFLNSMRDTLNPLAGKAFGELILLFPEFARITYKIQMLLVRIQNFFFGSIHKYVFDMSMHVISERRKNKDKRRKNLLQSMIDGRISAKVANEVDYESLSITSDFEKNVKSTGDKDGRQLTDTEIISNTVLFFKAGYETTSTSLAFISHILANHRDVQQKIRQEVSDAVHKEGRMNFKSLTQFYFMDAVIYETLRIYPPATFLIDRVSETDYKYHNINIPKGMPVMSPVYHIHHDPKFWEEPEKFDPYRFYGENKTNVDSLLWQPFGIGPRNCIGMKFALIEMKLVIAKLLLKYDLQPGPRTEIGHLTTVSDSEFLKPIHVYVRFAPRSTN